MHWTKEAWDKTFISGKLYWQLDDNEIKKILSHFPKAKTAIDFGCGTGDLARMLSFNNLQVDGFDFSQVAIATANKQRVLEKNDRVSFKVSDIENFIFEKKYDLAFIKFAFSFIEDKESFLSKIRENVNQGLIIITPVLEIDKHYNERINNISVLFGEIDFLLKKYFEDYKVIPIKQSHDEVDEKIFIVKFKN
ncbi:MAG: class I SAM-dependent methyltransferase [Candidatus Pacebacteria bacterium]|jgi:ubiquinone/menaquinone biosynthesis C-methylase UbiE|nr:class I SAM-dependent methyltransferase [Candidatus Paceibacterota bacterium]